MRLALKKGLSMVETILVLVVAATLVSLVAPSVRVGVENRQAKQALENLRSINHAVRMYEQDHGNLLDSGSSAIDLADLMTAGYLGQTDQYMPRKEGKTDSIGYEYRLENVSTGNWCAYAVRYTITGCDCDPDTNSLRTIQLNKNGQVADSVGFLGETASVC